MLQWITIKDKTYPARRIKMLDIFSPKVLQYVLTVHFMTYDESKEWAIIGTYKTKEEAEQVRTSLIACNDYEWVAP